MSVVKRGETYHLRRRVPRRFSAVEDREMVWISLHTDSRQLAERKAAAAWAEMLEAWEARLAGDTSDAEARFAAAKNLAHVRGLRYLPIDRVAALPVGELVKRVEEIPVPAGRPNRREAAALLGTIPEPPITVSRALDIYWGLARDRTLGKSADQIRRWRNPRIKAVRNFIRIIGDLPLGEIDRDHMLDFRQWWLDRVEAGDVSPGSANKDLTHLSAVLRTVVDMRRLRVDLPLGSLSLRETEAGTRPPFSVHWIRSKLLADGALDGLNAEARAILLGMINTGYRPSEGAGLTGETIRLDVDVPHISIEPDGRHLKTRHSRRIIPLLGVSLEAFRAHPDGFPRYREKPGLSGAINKYLRANGLMETEEHTLYSLRHAFEDRMLEAGIDERIRRDVLGHSLGGRERYGAGASLRHAAELLRPVAL